jgi:hypothetical protein
MNRLCRPVIPIVMFAALATTPLWADGPSTAPSSEDAPAPAAMAPMYISIGKDISLRLQLVRNTLDELNLDPAILAQARRLIDAPKTELDLAIDQMRVGRMPSFKRILAVPQTVRQVRIQLFALIGDQQARLLDQKLRSLRGEARWRIGQLRNGLVDLQLSDVCARQCDSILVSADPAVEKLPPDELDGDQYDKKRERMNNILANIHDRLVAILGPDEQARLGARLSGLACAQPTTRP